MWWFLSYDYVNFRRITYLMKSTKVQNPQRNLTEMLHVLGEHTGMKTELYQTNIKSQGFIYRASTGCID